MSPNRIRATLIAALVVAAVLNVVGTKENSPVAGGLSFAFFVGGVFLYVWWRREVVRLRRARVLAKEVLDREAQTSHETRTRTDQ